MNKRQLTENIAVKKSYLCVGLDTDIDKIPKHLLDTEDPVFEFNKKIIDATLPYSVAYKINTAFYEARGLDGWKSMEKTVKYLPENVFRIADAKRGDIGNTGDQYATAFFKNLPFDAITVSPYMGKDSITPFTNFGDKWTIILGITSNPGSADFQLLNTGVHFLYEEVISKSSVWGTDENMMYVTGATQAHTLKKIRTIIPEHFLLVPGVGAQGGSLEEVTQAGINSSVGLLVNSSRNIIYASADLDFAEAAATEAKKVQAEMEKLLDALLPK